MASDPATAEPSVPAQQSTFPTVLAEQRRGALLAELNEQLRDLVAACGDLSKPGSLTLKIEIKPNETGQMLVFDEVKVRKPVLRSRPSLFFADGDGGLHRRDPRQGELPLRQVPRTADGTTG